MTLAVTFLLAYLLGSIPFGYLLTRVAGLGDVRDIGSGNIGATNVLRTGHKGLAALTLLLDALKGTVAVLIGHEIGAHGGVAILASLLAGLGAFVDHVFPVWLGFRGGKGVATALGAIAALAPVSLPLPLLAFVTGFGLTRRVSVGSICAAMAAPFGSVVAGYPPEVSAAIAALACVILYRHRDNMARLRAGTEPRFGDRPERE